MDKPLRVVIVVGSQTAPEQLFKSAFGDRPPADALSEAAGREVHVCLLSWLPASQTDGLKATRALHAAPPPVFDRFAARLRIDRLSTLLRRSAPGRLVISLSPVDPSRVFWRSVRSDSEAMTLLGSADVVLAADLPAARTAWHMLHAGTVPRAYLGLQAAEKVLAATFRDTPFPGK